MGCVNSKCCRRHRSSSDCDSRDCLELGPRRNFSREQLLPERSLADVSVPAHNFKLQCSCLTQNGYYPEEPPDKKNQDSYSIETEIQGKPDVHFFGVFDGHGQFGADCSNFVKDKLVRLLEADQTLLNDPRDAYRSAFLTTNKELHDSKIDDSMSGTTAITVLVIANTIYVANVGDSRAVIAVKRDNKIFAEDLSKDQTPFRKDEYDRVRKCGARILSVDQVDGKKDPSMQIWDDEQSQGGDPPRLWLQNEMCPGTAFTRSVGDSIAENIGVFAEPEVNIVCLTPNHLFFVVASDGVFEFMTSQAVVDMAVEHPNPKDACMAIADQSYELWLKHEKRTDDITIIIVKLQWRS